MELKGIWVDDPVTKQPSVSLSICLVSFLAVLVASALQMLGKVSQTSNFIEIFYSACALYFGRRLNIGGKTVSADKADEIQSKVESSVQ